MPRSRLCLRKLVAAGYSALSRDIASTFSGNKGKRLKVYIQPSAKKRMVVRMASMRLLTELVGKLSTKGEKHSPVLPTVDKLWVTTTMKFYVVNNIIQKGKKIIYGYTHESRNTFGPTACI